MPDPFDGAKDALSGAQPTSDLWAEARRRAASGEVVELTPTASPARRGRWLAAAAVVALVAGTIGVLSLGDDSTVDTTPTSDDDPELTVYAAENGCSFGITGEPLLLAEGPADPPLFDPSSQPAGQTIAHTSLGAQVAEIHVPGVVVTDLVGERVEDVELRRGTAQVWFGTDFVQVRWFTGSNEPCDSFTVTVTGSTEDGNRHAAVDLADRILLPDELGMEESPPGEDDVTTLLEGDWRLESSTIDGEATDGDGLRFTFLDGEAGWSDGCNAVAGPYSATGDTTFRMGQLMTTLVGCPPTPTTEAVQAVMGADAIEVAFDGDLLVLSGGGAVLALRPT